MFSDDNNPPEDFVKAIKSVSLEKIYKLPGEIIPVVTLPEPLEEKTIIDTDPEVKKGPGKLFGLKTGSRLLASRQTAIMSRTRVPKDPPKPKRGRPPKSVYEADIDLDGNIIDG